MPQSEAAPVILLPGEGRRIDFGVGAMDVKASGEQTLGVFSLLESDEPPNFGPPLHIHHDAAESFYVIEGEYVMFIDGKEWTCPAGSFVYIPKGVAHTFKVGATHGRKLNIYTPAAMVGYFDELAAMSANDSVDEQRLSEMARRYAMEVVGPIPDSYV